MWKVWNVIYPILIYFVVSNVVIYFAVLILGITSDTYSSQYMMLQTIATAVSIPVLYGFYQKDKMFYTVFQHRMVNAFSEIETKKKVKNGMLMFIGGALSGFVLNNIIAATGLTQQSSGYKEVTTQFFAGGILFEIVGAGILIPIAEEILYRGVVYGRLTDLIGIRRAMIVSAILFGGFHFNLVQFIYAFILGIMLAWFFEKSKHLYGAILGHMGANLLSILRVETNLFQWIENSKIIYCSITLICMGICGLIFFLINKKSRN